MGHPEILVDDDVVGRNSGNLQDRVAHVPTGDAIAGITGDRHEHAAASFYARLKAGAELVGTHADVVASAVKQNAEALKQTVAGLAQSDATSATEATQLTELVEGTATTTTAATVAESAKTVDDEKTGGHAGDDGAQQQSAASAGGDL